MAGRRRGHSSDLSDLGPWLHAALPGIIETVRTPPAARGLVMMVVGLIMILASVMIAVLTEEPLPVAFGAVGIVFLAVGARQRRLG